MSACVGRWGKVLPILGGHRVKASVSMSLCGGITLAPFFQYKYSNGNNNNGYTGGHGNDQR